MTTTKARKLSDLFAGDIIPANPAIGSPPGRVISRGTRPCDNHNPNNPDAETPIGYDAHCDYCEVSWILGWANGNDGGLSLSNPIVYQGEKSDVPATVRAGQVWADYDKRSAGRMIRIVDVNRTHARVALVGQRGRPARGHEAEQLAEPGRETLVRRDRFAPTSTGYVLVSDARICCGERRDGGANPRTVVPLCSLRYQHDGEHRAENGDTWDDQSGEVQSGSDD